MGNRPEQVLVGATRVSEHALHAYVHVHVHDLHVRLRRRSQIRETLNNLILKSPQEWQTSVALPFTRIEGDLHLSYALCATVFNTTIHC